MKRERILPCVKHPKAFWPWDKPYLREEVRLGNPMCVTVVFCPMCNADKYDRLRAAEVERENKVVRAWNTHAYGADDEA